MFPFQQLSLSTSDVEIEDSFSDSEPSDIEEDVEAETGLDDDTPLASTVKLLSMRKKMLEKKQRQQRKLQVRSGPLWMCLCLGTSCVKSICFISFLLLLSSPAPTFSPALTSNYCQLFNEVIFPDALGRLGHLGDGSSTEIPCARHQLLYWTFGPDKGSC